MGSTFDVSVVIPVYNAGTWLEECLQSVAAQEHSLRVEVSIFMDSCTDDSEEIVKRTQPLLEEAGFKVNVSKEDNDAPKGVGYSKNKAINQSCGEYLCFLDSDDVMLPRRIHVQHELAQQNQDAIIGSRFRRFPEGSTSRFTKWANQLTPSQLLTQIYTSNGPTVIMPTWFCHRKVVDRIGGFTEGGRGTPEDLLFFYEHIRLGGSVLRSDEELLIYRYHPDAATFSVLEETIWNLRVRELESVVLAKWDHFTIWNGGKQGRKFYRSIQEENRKKVVCFCDVDPKKVGSFYMHYEIKGKVKPRIPIIHFTEAKQPFILCMKMDLTGGAFEKNLASMQLIEGKDFFHFN